MPLGIIWSQPVERFQSLEHPQHQMPAAVWRHLAHVQTSPFPAHRIHPFPVRGTLSPSSLAPAGRRPLELRPDSSPSVHTIANRSPPSPHICGYTTASTRFAATAASTAFPPEVSTASPADDAR